jgi:preprotein translocase subunit SecE
MIQRIREFLQEVQIEMRRVSFPSRNETVGATAVVIAFVVAVSIFLALTDAALSRLVSRVIG